MKTLRGKILLGTTLAALLTISAGVGATAYADVEPAGKSGKVYTVPKGGGAVSFSHKGDNFLVSDTKADGYGVQAIYTINGQGNDYLRNNKGAHTERFFNRDLAEGTTIKMQVCLTKNGTPVGKTCGKWKSARA